MLAWIEEHLTTILWTAGLSLIVILASMIVIPIVLVKLPPDYFKRDGREEADDGPKNPALRKALRIGKNILGWFLIAAGIAMLILPGQGVLAILIGVMLADFPGKKRLQRWIMSREAVLKGANKLRDRFGKPPLEAPQRTDQPAPAHTSPT